MDIMKHSDRLITFFFDLVRIASPSFKEEAVHKYCKDHLQAVGATVSMHRYQSDDGNKGENLVAVLKKNSDDFQPLFLSAHADTVTPCEGVQPVIEEGIIRSAGKTILGADNKAAIAVFLEVMTRLKETGTPHGRIEILISSAEEVGLHGARAFDTSLFNAKMGLVLDASGSPGVAVNEAPGHTRFRLTVRGKKSHAGIEPENGINAIRSAAAIILATPDGRLGDDTTANWGTICGGTAGNIVPDTVLVEGEVRSHQPGLREAWLETLRLEASKTDGRFGSVSSIEIINAYSAYRVEPDSDLVRLVETACNNTKIPFATHRAGGCSDANALSEKGLSCLNLACGMQAVHTTDEWIRIRDLEDTVRLVWEILTRGVRSTPEAG